MVAVKICGVRTIAAAEACAALSIDFAGFNFVPGSRRAIDIPQAQALRHILGRTHAVGVFQDASAEAIARVVGAVGLDWVQLHGSESPDLCADLRASGLRVIKALPLSEQLYDRMRSYAGAADILLIDAPIAGGGVPWAWNRHALHGDPLFAQTWTSPRPRLFVAGGLTPSTVALAIATLAPDGVDVATGVESVGAIDPVRIQAFHAAVRASAIPMQHTSS